MAEARDRQSDLAVMDAEEYQQKTLLKRILDGRERVEEVANKARERYIAGKIDQRGRNTMVLWAVQDYISTGWTLLLNHAEAEADEGADSEYLFGRDLGQIDLLGDTIRFRGLHDILTADEIYVRETERVVDYPHGPSQTVTRAETASVPREISWRGCRLMDEFLANEHGIELKVSQMDDELKTFGFSTMELEEAAANVETMEDIEETIKSDIDYRVLKEEEAEAEAEAATNGGGSGGDD